MPSAHSQFVFFAASFFGLLLMFKWNSKRTNILETITIFGTASYVAIGRVYLQYHTYYQVFWGAIVGFVIGAVWFFVYCKSSSLFCKIEKSKIGQFFGLCHSESLRCKGMSNWEWSREGAKILRNKSN